METSTPVPGEVPAVAKEDAPRHTASKVASTQSAEEAQPFQPSEPDENRRESEKLTIVESDPSPHPL